MACRAPLLLYVRLAATTNNALTTQFAEILRAVVERRAYLVVVALDAHHNLRDLIERACIRYETLLFHVPRQGELRTAARVDVPVGAVAIVAAPRGHDFMQLWIQLLHTISGLEEELGYQPRI